MLSNAYLLAKFRFDTAENDPAKNLQNFSKFAKFARILLIGPIYPGAQDAPGHDARAARAAYLGDPYAESGQTLQGSFSAVSKPNFASKY